MKLEARGIPPIGSTLSMDEQIYELTNVRTENDGLATRRWLVWRSNCPSCGSDFDTETSGMASRPIRRCELCRAEVGTAPVKGDNSRVRIILRFPGAVS